MALLPLRPVRLPKAAEQFYDGWLADLEGELVASATATAIVRAFPK